MQERNIERSEEEEEARALMTLFSCSGWSPATAEVCGGMCKTVGVVRRKSNFAMPKSDTIRD